MFSIYLVILASFFFEAEQIIFGLDEDSENAVEMISPECIV